MFECSVGATARERSLSDAAGAAHFCHPRSPRSSKPDNDSIIAFNFNNSSAMRTRDPRINDPRRIFSQTTRGSPRTPSRRRRRIYLGFCLSHLSLIVTIMGNCFSFLFRKRRYPVWPVPLYGDGVCAHGDAMPSFKPAVSFLMARHIMVRGGMRELKRHMPRNMSFAAAKVVLSKVLVGYGLLAIDTGEKPEPCSWMANMAGVVLVLEGCSQANLQLELLELSCERNIKLFYYKRASCTCFVKDQLRLLQDTSLDTGRCEKCNVTKQRRVLLKCGRCFVTYCSKNCQSADWKAHKHICERWG